LNTLENKREYKIKELWIHTGGQIIPQNMSKRRNPKEGEQNSQSKHIIKQLQDKIY